MVILPLDFLIQIPILLIQLTLNVSGKKVRWRYLILLLGIFYQLCTANRIEADTQLQTSTIWAFQSWPGETTMAAVEWKRPHQLLEFDGCAWVSVLLSPSLHLCPHPTHSSLQTASDTPCLCSCLTHHLQEESSCPRHLHPT